MSKRMTALAGAVLLFILSAAAIAEVPVLISYQGRLTDEFAEPLPDDDYAMRFAIYEDSLSSKTVWEEAQVVTATRGIFTVLLGSVTPLDPSDFDTHDLFLGMRLASEEEEFQPRLRLSSAGFSFRAMYADTADYALAVPAGDAVGWIDAGTVVHTETLTDSVGIGTTTPTERLEVVGNLRTTGKATFGLVHTNTGASGFVAGYTNSLTGDRATITGGYLNTLTADYAVIGGGARNKARGIYSVVAGGGGPEVADSNSALGEYSTVSGGRRNTSIGDRACIGGGYGSIAGGSHATIGGGRLHLTNASYATIAGGFEDTVLSDYGTVGGGANNRVAGPYCTIAGGGSNFAWGSGYATISGGYDNEAYGQYSMIAGGYRCRVAGDYTFAAGRYVWVDGKGNFVWADSSPFSFGQGTYDNKFLARATGGVAFWTGIDSNGDKTSGASLNAGSGTWSSTSDRNLKENFAPINEAVILERLQSLDIQSWNYIAQGDSIRHIGPVAQDLYAAFGYGADDRHITTVDADGIALAAIKALAAVNSEQQAEINDLKTQIAELRKLLSKQQGDR